MKPLRVGVVGVGHLGQHHARILGSLPGVKLVGVADSRAEQARAIAARFQTEAIVDYRELLDRVDAVSVAVPTRQHREVAGAFLERGVATMAEKPLAGSLAEAEELVALSRSTGALLQVGHIERFNPVLAAFRDAAIRPKYLTAERLSIYTFRSTDIGVVHDLMIHDLDLILDMVRAPVRSVSAVGVCLFGDHEDVANARVEFQDGTVANITASRASYAPTRKMRVWGAEGYVSLDFAAKEATVVQPSPAFLAGEVDFDDVDLSQPAAIKDHLFGRILKVDQIQKTDREPLALELENFVAAVRGEAAPRVTGAEALGALRVADQIIRCINAHRWDEAAAPAPAPVLKGPHAWRRNAMVREG